MKTFKLHVHKGSIVVIEAESMEDALYLVGPNVKVTMVEWLEGDETRQVLISYPTYVRSVH
jgi:hypothetical protein